MYEAVGYWWNADSPGTKAPGVVRLADEGNYELTIIDSLDRQLQVPGTLANATLHGFCGRTKYTLLRAIQTNQNGGANYPDGTAEIWKSFEMIRGAHLLPSTRFERASFSCTGLSRLWGRWHIDGDDSGVGTVLREVRGCEVKIFRSRESALSLGRSSYTDHIAIEVAADDGLTLEQLDGNFVLPIRTFTACATNKESVLSRRFLWNIIDDDDTSGSGPQNVEVDPWISSGADERHRSSLITENDEFFEDVMTCWLQLSDTLLNAMVIAAPRQQRGYLEMETFAAVSAVEQLHRELVKRRSTPVRPTRSRFTLQQRLEDLLGGDGESFFKWFLQQNIGKWAYVSAKVRNRLGHGLALPEGQSEDYGLLMDVLDGSRNIIFLRLLLECGFPQDELKDRIENDQHWKLQLEHSGRWLEYERSLKGLGTARV